MGDTQKTSPAERDVEQAIIALKKGSYLLKYGRRGKPKFCPFRLANSFDDHNNVSDTGFLRKTNHKILDFLLKEMCDEGAIFQRYPRPEKEYQSFSLIHGDRSLDLICKDKDEAEVWFVGLKALISPGNLRKWRTEPRNEGIASDTQSIDSRRNSPVASPSGSNHAFHKVISSPFYSCRYADTGDVQKTLVPHESPPGNGFGKAFSDVMLYTASTKASASTQSELVVNSINSLPSGAAENGKASAAETFRVSLSSALSSSSQGSGHDDFESLGDVFIWGEGVGNGLLGGGDRRVGSLYISNMDAHFPKALESTMVLDVNNIACGARHAVLVTKQGEIFSWGEESGGRLGHGVEADVSHPKLIETLNGLNVVQVACGEYHTCAVTLSGDLYTWGDGVHNSGLLGNRSEVSTWIPKKVGGQIEGLQVLSVSCGPWHTAAVTSAGQLFTFGDGTFGALGHGDRASSNMPREVESLKGSRTVRVACGVWHTAAIVDELSENSSTSNSSSGKLFTWGDGDNNRLGHGDEETRLVPACVASLDDLSFCQIACGNDITVALTTTGQVYTMGSTGYGQLGNPEADGKVPTCVNKKISSSFVEEIACGSFHVAVLTSKAEVYTWGKGANGRLGHGDNDDRHTPKLVEILKDRQVKSVVCGSSFTTVICLHKWVSSSDNSICSGCRNPFGFRRKRHNCYNCGLVFCKACSSRKSVRAALAPNFNKPYRVCDDCFAKLKKFMESGTTSRFSRNQSGGLHSNFNESLEKENLESRTQGYASRLSSVESFKLAESKNSRNSRKLESTSNLALFDNGKPQWGSSYSSKLSISFFGSSKKLLSSSVPSSRAVSRTTSPVSRRSSPPLPALSSLTPDVIVHDPKHANDSLSQEIVKLRAQVEELTQKSDSLEAELERTSRQLKEANETAEDEAEKCKSAKEVIKSLTAQEADGQTRTTIGESVWQSRQGSRWTERLSNVAKTGECVDDSDGVQAVMVALCDACDAIVATGSAMTNLRDVAERIPEGSLASKPVSVSGYSGELSPTASDSHFTSTMSHVETNGSSATPLASRGTTTQIEQAEWVVQDQPGVYITLSLLPGGGKNLKRIRFSRRHFSEKQAEEWWTKYRAQVYQRHDIRNAVVP
ncbi:hypothetical protein Syun_023669 [Stephania yunnanensis]|uniref:Uncharacterized protein n=1 Tax=Stephania yunnanensis TaxID=152371 RepID=A0AAP0FHL5_9MAGN